MFVQNARWFQPEQHRHRIRKASTLAPTPSCAIGDPDPLSACDHARGLAQHGGAGIGPPVDPHSTRRGGPGSKLAHAGKPALQASRKGW
jgi:hypothetical protein